MTFAGEQSLVVVFSTLQTGGSPRLQHDLEHVVLVQLLTTPLIVLVVLVAPHCFCSALPGTGTANRSTRSKNRIAVIASSPVARVRLPSLRPRSARSLHPFLNRVAAKIASGFFLRSPPPPSSRDPRIESGPSNSEDRLGPGIPGVTVQEGASVRSRCAHLENVLG
jgi:hypothetical protein